MGIGGVTSSNTMSVMQMTKAGAPDAKSKKIQDEITDVERKLQKVSSDAGLSYTEKTDERKTLQKEISRLNTKLDQRQEELLRSQKKESMLAELREAQKPETADDEADALQTKTVSSDTVAEANETTAAAESLTQPQGTVIASTDDGTVILKEEAKPAEAQESVSEREQSVKAEEKNDAEEAAKVSDSDTDTDVRPSSEEMYAMVSADTSAQLASRQGTIIAKTEDGIAILKGEIAQDERSGVNTERKQAELEKMEKQQERATAFQFSVLGDDTENNAYTTAIRATQEEQAAQQRFQVSIA